jgi:hypothetical protein
MRFGRMTRQKPVEKLTHSRCLALAIDNYATITGNYTTDKIRKKITPPLDFSEPQAYVVAVRQVCRRCPPWAFPP